MSLTNTKLNISYSLDSDPKEFVFTDVTDYASQSVALVDITGSIKVTAPSGVTYSGQPNDIDGSVGRINQNQILVPLLSDGTPEIGNYTFEYTATDGVDTVVYTKLVAFQYVKPVASIQTTVDCLSPLLKTEDTTNYLYGSISPVDRFNLVAADSGANTFSIAGERSAFVRQGDTFSIISSTGNDGDYTVTSVSYDGVTDRTVIGVANVADNTADGTLVTRKSEIFYPQVLGLNPVVGYSKVLETSVFYTETHEFKYVTKSFYDLTDGVSIVDFNTDSDELKIECDVKLCEVFCCINSKFNEYLTFKNRGNTTLSEIALEQYILATSHLSALKQAFQCGDSQAVSNLVTQIQDVTNCNGDCSCSDSEPVLVTGLGGGSNTVVQSSGNGIIVQSVVAGDTTTYTLSLSQSILDDIANASATSSVVSGDGSLIVTSSSALGNTEYDVRLPPATPIIEPKEFMAFDLELDLTSGITPTVSNVTIQNESNLQAGVTVSDPDAGAPGYYWQRFEFSTFQVTGNVTYKAFVSATYSVTDSASGVDSDNPNGLFSRYLTPSITLKDTGSFNIVLLGANGTPIKRSDLSIYENVKLNIKIIE